jgi:hypothetical protein
MMVLGSRWLALVVLGALAVPIQAAAQSVEEGRRLYLEAEFDQAREEFERVLQRPSLTRDEAVEAHAHLAALLMVLRDEEGAARHAEAAVALDPAAAPPAGAQSRVTTLFEEARGRTEGERARLRLTADGQIVEGEEAVLRLRLAPAPDLLASELRLRCVSRTESASDSGAPPEITVTLPVAGDEVSCRGGAHTVGGAALLTISEELSVGSGAGRAAVGVEEEDEEGGSALPWILAGAGVLVAAAVVIAVVLVTSAGGDTATLREPQIEGW